MSFESPKARDSRFYCFLSDYRARIFDSARLGLVFSEDPVSGSDFTNRRKSRARILKHGSRRLGESRILPFYTPTCMKKANWIQSCINCKIKCKCKPQSSLRIRGEKATGAVLYYYLQLVHILIFQDTLM